MTVFNDILIPRFKEAFTLDFYHAMFVQLAFFGAYFIGSLVYFIISATTGDPIVKIGYKNGCGHRAFDFGDGQRVCPVSNRGESFCDGFSARNEPRPAA